MPLQRFIDAQSPVIHTVKDELRAGRKRSHWMWFVFPQLRGLGHSQTARHYGIASLDEARAYLSDPALGPRLLECTALALEHRQQTANQIFGTPDDLKFRSCMTLFHRASPTEPLFREALDAFYEGREDPMTLRLLQTSDAG